MAADIQISLGFICCLYDRSANLPGQTIAKAMEHQDTLWAKVYDGEDDGV
jgi:hypothetical protein